MSQNDSSGKRGNHCEECGVHRESEPLRNIRMIGGDRQLLCEKCYEEAIDEQRVSSLDPRLPGENA